MANHNRALDRAKYRQLEDWLYARKDMLAKNTLPMDVLASEVSRQVGFDVTTNHLRIASKTMNITIKTLGTVTGLGPNVRATSLFPMMNAIEVLYQQLGAKLPPEFVTWANDIRSAAQRWKGGMSGE